MAVCEPLAKYATLDHHLQGHMSRATMLVAGWEPQARDDELWAEDAGVVLRSFLDELTEVAGFGGTMSSGDYSELFELLIGEHEARDPITPRADIMIWGTMEARVQGAERVVLAGLNEGTWPKAPSADPWLNRTLRARAGLLIPERRIGLAAHDFQQAIAAPEVFLTRSTLDAEADTVPSRWLNRIQNLLNGIDGAGTNAYAAMVKRGQDWIRLSAALDAPKKEEPSAMRPAPSPPIPARPNELWVTDIRNLIRDPYSVYASKILDLREIDPLSLKPDARFRGVALHKVFESTISKIDPSLTLEDQIEALKATAKATFENMVPWVEIRSLWLGRINRLAEPFWNDEMLRQEYALAHHLEERGRMTLQNPSISIRAKADRIDRRHDGTLEIFDYKSTIPTKTEVAHYEKQLLIEALIADAGGFEGLPEGSTASVGYIGVGTAGGSKNFKLDADQKAEIRAELETLLQRFHSADLGYASRRDPKDGQGGTFDQLARYGEWSDVDKPVTTVLK